MKCKYFLGLGFSKLLVKSVFSLARRRAGLGLPSIGLMYLCIILLFSPLVSANITPSLETQLSASRHLEKAILATVVAEKYRQSDPNKAIYFANIALEQLAITPHPTTRLKALNILAEANVRLGHYNIGAKYIDSALALADILQQPLQKSETFYTLGFKYMFDGKFIEALDYFNQSIDIQIGLKSERYLPRLYNGLGAVEMRRGNYKKAIEVLLHAVDYAKKTGDYRTLGINFLDLGWLHSKLENYDKALQYYSRSLDIFLEIEEFTMAIVMYSKMGDILRLQKNLQAANDVLLVGLDLLKTKNIVTPLVRITLFVALGEVYLDLNEIQKAFYFFKKSQSINEITQYFHEEMDLLSGFTRGYLMSGNPNLALQYAVRYRQLADREKNIESQKKANYFLYQIYKLNGNINGALESIELYNKYKKILRKDEEKINYLQEKHEIAIREKEFAILKLEVKYQRSTRKLVLLISVIAVLVIGFLMWFRSNRVKTTLLEKRVAQRTQNISDKNKTIQKLLDQKDKLLQHKNDLFSMVSHEFRTPLTLIMGPLEILYKNTKNKESRKTLTKIQNNTQRLRCMVDQLVELAKLDQKVKFISDVLNVNKNIRQIVDSMEAIFENHKLYIHIDTYEKLWIDISAEVLEKIIINLLSNAVKYTEKNGKIEVATFKKNNYVCISVKDTGIGVDQADQQKIFQRFTRVESHFTRNKPGSGIGLALVKEFVESFNGEVTLQSQLNHGSIFTLKFPLATEPKETKMSTHPVSLSKNTEADDCLYLADRVDEINLPVSIRLCDDINFLNSSNQDVDVNAANKKHDEKHTILLVEDNEAVCDFIGHCLSPYFYCIFALDGRQGIKMALQEVPDLIITDLMMPNINGYQLASVLRQDQLTSHIPMLMLTAKGGEKYRQTAWKLKFDEYIEKPFSAAELVLRCENLLYIRQLLSMRLRADLTDTSLKNIYDTQQLNKNDKKFLNRLDGYLYICHEEITVSAKTISATLAVSEKQLQRKIKAITGESIPSYVKNFRLKQGAQRLLSGESVTHVALSVGFSSPNYFSSTFTARYGCTPSEYQKLHKK